MAPDDDDWLYWLLVAGRGAGKTEAAARYFDRVMSDHPGWRLAIVAPKLGTARGVCVEGESGLLQVNPRIHFNRSWGELRWPNGAQAQIFGAFTPEDVEALRGPQFHCAWLEEMAAWRQDEGCFNMLRLGLRLGDRPRAVITTTPKPRALLKRLLADPRTRLSHATTDDNPYLHADVRAEFERQYGGTRLGRQELLGELLEDVEGAFWQYGWLDEARVKEAPHQQRIVVAVDPAATHGDEADETAIAVAGLGDDGEYYVFGCEGYRLSPHGWASRVLDAYDQWQADRIIVERNNGGEMCETTLRSVRASAPIETIVASRGKTVRAEPIAALYEQGRVHHVGTFGPLEDQMVTFPVSNEHDDRVDALVYALTAIVEGQPGTFADFEGYYERSAPIAAPPRVVEQRSAFEDRDADQRQEETRTRF